LGLAIRASYESAQQRRQNKKANKTQMATPRKPSDEIRASPRRAIALTLCKKMKTFRPSFRFVIGVFLILAASMFVLFAAVIFGAFDIVERSYETKQDAKDDRLFERGWLPDIIPTSSSTIEVSSNLDINTSTGSFEFNVEELDDFVRSIQNSLEQDIRLMGDYPRMKFLSDSGYMSFHYRENGTVWRFFIHPHRGLCEYWAHNI